MRMVGARIDGNRGWQRADDSVSYYHARDGWLLEASFGRPRVIFS